MDRDQGAAIVKGLQALNESLYDMASIYVSLKAVELSLMIEQSSLSAEQKTKQVMQLMKMQEDMTSGRS
jgi:hypothetical protein